MSNNEFPVNNRGTGFSPAGADVPPPGGTGLDLKAKQDIVNAINNLAQVFAAAFPQATDTTSATATGGAATLPGNPVGFLNVTINGQPQKIPYYDS